MDLFCMPAKMHLIASQNDHRNNDGRKPYPKPSNDAESVATNLFPIVKRRRLTNILVGKERPFSHSRICFWLVRFFVYLLGPSWLASSNVFS
ncbi:hypothetical protein ACN42_g395 [Penicillium freii]|uniref:Uncharacterized protein n=1 Tax=Penicillium freii TaxID=48697 RepID=A0A117NSK4_PENFR|nr:hypothetical protein ACN42_g395 [Penicillium freii]